MENKGSPSALLAAQRNEKTEHVIYTEFARTTRHPGNREVLLRLAETELEHYNRLKQLSGREVSPDRFRVRLYCLLSRVMGISFGLKLMENRRGAAMAATGAIPEREYRRERDLLRLIDEERLSYIGAIVLGLNDALVELTGALAGFTFAMPSSRLVATAGLITGIAAALSMGSTGYLSARSGQGDKAPLKYAMYTGLTYLLTVFLLVTPFLLLSNMYLSLGLTLSSAVAIILVFNLYLSVAKELPFWSRFREMALLSLGIAGVSFGIGLLVRRVLGVET